MRFWNVWWSANSRWPRSWLRGSIAKWWRGSIGCSTSPNTSGARPPLASRSPRRTLAAAAVIPSPTSFVIPPRSSANPTTPWSRAPAAARRRRSRGRSTGLTCGDKGRSDRTNRLVVRRGGGRIGGGGRCFRGGGCRRGRRRGTLLGCSPFGRRPRHLLGALFGDDDIALLFGLGLVVDRLQCVGPGLSGGLAGAGRIELLTVAKRIGRRRIGLAADRHRLVHVFTGIAIAVEGCLRRRAKRLAGPFVIGETARHGGERDRKISAVATADADRAIGSGLRTQIGAGRRHRIVIVVAEQAFQEIARAPRGVGILRSAIVLGERGQHRTALIVPIVAADAAGTQPLEAGRDLLEVGAHLLNLGVDRTALRRLTAEQREKSRTVAAHALGLRGNAVELALLFGRGILVAADLIVLGRIPAAAVDGRQLRLQPWAHRIDGGPLRRRRRGRRLTHLRRSVNAQRGRAEQRGTGKNPSGKAGNQRFRHIRPSHHDPIRLDRIMMRSLCLRMIFSENRSYRF